MEAGAQEARGRDLLRGFAAQMAWPLAKDIRGRQAFSRGILPLDSQLERRRSFAVFKAHEFKFDKLSEIVEARTQEQQTYAATFRYMSDHGIPGDVLEAIEHNHYPQFNLRNIGRVEKTDVDPEDRLRMDRKQGVSARAADDLFEEVRSAEMPEVQFAEVWSERLMKTVRGSFRRLMMEDPWEHRFGAEAKANYDGPVYQFVVEGTHPEDMPGAWFGPEPIRGPAKRIVPRGQEGADRATNIYDIIKIVSAGSE
ncbi:MAG: hypothetical protein KC502_07115 [Myxococcales bacterium]|nr:hypothetical protein [Myxococcales bacterium]